MRRVILLFLSLLTAIPCAVADALAPQILPNSPAITLSGEDKQAINDSITQAQLFVTNELPQVTSQIPQIIANATAALAAQEKKAEQDRTAHIIWQNSLVGNRDFTINGDLPVIDNQAPNEPTLFGDEVEHGLKITNNFRVDIYNRDLVNGGAVLVTAAATYYLLCKLHEQRINHVFKRLTENPQATRKHLQKLATAKTEDATDHAKKHLFKRIFSRKTPKATKTDSLIGYNPFKKELALPVAGFAIAALIAWQLKSRLLVSEPFKTETWQRYVQNGDEYSALSKPPISAIPLAETAVQVAQNPINVLRLPFNVVRDYFGKAFDEVPVMAKNWALPAIPDAALPALQVVEKITFFGWSLKIRGYLYDSVWKTYLISHTAEAQKLLLAYEQAKNNHKNEKTDQKLKKTEKDLMDFIKQGHALTSRLPGYFMNSWNSQQPVPWWCPTINKTIALAAIVGIALTARKTILINNGDQHE